MLSLTRTLRALNDTEQRLRTWWEAYSGVLTSLEDASVELSGDHSYASRETVAKSRVALTPLSEPDQIIESSTIAQQAVKSLVHGLVEAQTTREKEFKKIIRITAEAGATMIRSGKSHAEEIRHFAAQVEEASCLESVVEIRCQMARRLTELNGVARRIEEDSAHNAEDLNRQMDRIQERLKAAENLAETDTLTKLGNRRLLERKIAMEIDAQNQFCLVVLDLNGFKGVNDRFGHTQGDKLLQAVAHALSNSVRATDSVGRWGGDEFVMVLHGMSLAEGEVRISQIQNRAFGEFILSDTGQEIKVHVTACFGIAERRSGETADQLFERADRRLYELKQALHKSKPKVAPSKNTPVLVEARS